MVIIERMTKIYNLGRPNELKALDTIDLKLEQNEMVAVMGRSGAGKSTLLHIMGGLDVPSEGRYIIKDVDTSKISERKLAKLRNKDIGILLQDHALIPGETALQNVMTPLYFDNTPLAKMKEKALSALKSVCMASYINQKAGTLSGGQKQRVALARALVNDPLLLLADEPTGALDSQTASEIIDLITQINKRGVCVIIVTHDIEVAKCCQKIITLNDGRIIKTESQSIL
jgi:putative ABC transport system ATP-binding protein